MLVDGRTVAPGAEFRFDLCIIGAGPAGLAIARELASSSLSLAVVESGGFEPDRRTQNLYRGKNIGRIYWPLEVPRVRYFGGAGNKWGGWCRPLDQIDFERRSWVPDSGWPISRADLEPYYRRAETFCELETADYEPARWRAPGADPLDLATEEFPPAIFRFSPPTRFGRVYRQELLDAPRTTTFLHANVLEIIPDAALGAVTRVRVASLRWNQFHISARAFVLATGGIENARMLLASNAVAQSGLGNENDLVGRYFMEHPHVAFGHFLPADPGFSGDFYIKSQRRDGVAKGVHVLSERLAREHGLLGVSLSLEPPGYSIGDFFNRWPRRLVLTLTRIERLIQERPRLFAVVRSVERFIRRLQVRDQHHHFSRLLAAYLQQLRGGEAVGSAASLPLFRIYCRGEQIPNRDSRVLLDSKRDALGMPRALLDWRLTSQDTDSIARAAEHFALAAGRSGLGRVCLPDRGAGAEWQQRIVGGPHHMGTTRMAASPRQGVVDSDCRVHNLANLYVTGSSVFPTGGYANPTLTLIALAFRLADHLRVKLG